MIGFFSAFSGLCLADAPWLFVAVGAGTGRLGWRKSRRAKVCIHVYLDG